MKKKIFIFGNPLLPFDSLPIKLAPHLQAALPEFEFIVADPNENLKPENKELIIIDTIEGIDEVVVIDDIDKIKTEKIYSLHDFDLGYNLKLLHKLGELVSVKIIGVPARQASPGDAGGPMEGDEKIIFSNLINILKRDDFTD